MTTASRAAVRGSLETSLIPPEGAIYGTISFADDPFSQQAGWADDRTIQGSQQPAGVQLVREFWVYWVNGQKPNYYIVIQKVTGQATPGTVVASNLNSQGFFQYGLTVANLVVDAAKAPFLDETAGKATLLKSSDFQAQGDNVLVSIAQSMIVMALKDGSYFPTQFTAGDSGTMALAGWGVQNQSQGLRQATYFHQAAVWDPSVDRPDKWGHWYLKAFDKDDNVRAPGPTSLSTLPFMQHVVWRFDPATPSDDPPPFMVTFSTTATQELAAWHNPAGCYTTISGSGDVPTISGAHHLKTIVTPFNKGWTENLQHVLKKV